MMASSLASGTPLCRAALCAAFQKLLARIPLTPQMPVAFHRLVRHKELIDAIT